MKYYIVDNTYNLVKVEEHPKDWFGSKENME